MTDTKPTPQEVDSLCIAYDGACARLETAEQEKAAAKAPLLVAVRTHGYVPAQAEKTKRLEGVLYIADSVVGTTVSIQETAVAQLQSELSRYEKPKVFAELFEPAVKHTLLKGAADKLKLEIAGLSDNKQAHLLAIFAKCFTAESKAPTLSVDLGAAIREKEALAAQKAEAKAAKAAAKAAKKK